jgi:hypothetical protein
VLGMFGSMLAAILFGFGVAGTVIAIEAGGDGLIRFLSFTGIALLLALMERECCGVTVGPIEIVLSMSPMHRARLQCTG